MLYPPSSISTKAERIHKIVIYLPKSSLSSDDIIPVDVYKSWRDARVIELKNEANTKEADLKKKTKSVQRTDTTEKIVIEATRFEAVVDGNSVKCSECGSVLAGW